MPFTPDELEELRRRSVKEEDVFVAPGAPGGRSTILQILVPTASPATILPPQLPLGLKDRDRILSMTPRVDAQWGAANGIAITKVAALAWETKGSVELRSRRAQELLLHADSVNGPGGWVSFVSKQLRDFNNTNNGCHFEIVRQKQAYGSKVLGIAHLSSMRCYRTGDPEYPIVYRDRLGREHLLRWWEVVSIADLPDPDEMLFGAGLCAAERAYQQIIKLAALERFVYEKVSASRPLAIHIVNGLQTEDLEAALRSAHDQRNEKGLTTYMGAVVMTTLKPDAAPALVTIPLAELPNGFNSVEERDRADLIYANSLGLDPQDLKPISNQQLGAGGQSVVLHEKAKGRGLVAYRQSLVHHINELVLDEKTKFLFTEHDYDDMKKQIDISKGRAEVAGTRVTYQITTAEEERQLLVDQDELPKSFIEYDTTAGETVSDTDKPEVEEVALAPEDYVVEDKSIRYGERRDAQMKRLRGMYTEKAYTGDTVPFNPFRPFTVVRAPDITFKHGRHDQSTHGRNRGRKGGGGGASEPQSESQESPKLQAARAKLAKLKEDLAAARAIGDLDTVRRLENGRGSVYSRVKQLEKAEKEAASGVKPVLPKPDPTPPPAAGVVAPVAKPISTPVVPQKPAPEVTAPTPPPGPAVGGMVQTPLQKQYGRVPVPPEADRPNLKPAQVAKNEQTYANNLKYLAQNAEHIKRAEQDIMDPKNQSPGDKAYFKSQLAGLKQSRRKLEAAIENHEKYGVPTVPKGGFGTTLHKPKLRTDVPDAATALNHIRGTSVVGSSPGLAHVEGKVKAAQQKFAEIAAKDPKGKTTAYHVAMSQVAVAKKELADSISSAQAANGMTVQAMVAHRAPAKIKVTYPNGKPPADIQAKIDKELDFVKRVIGEGTGLDGKTLRIYYNNHPGRASGGGAGIHIYSNARNGVVVHETMHWFEDHAHGGGARARKFLNDRTKGEPEVRLNKLKPMSNYADDEVTKPDKFVDPYVGRIYKGGGTEVTSMGLDALYVNAKHFADSDPDHFTYIWENVVQATY